MNTTVYCLIIAVLSPTKYPRVMSMLSHIAEPARESIIKRGYGMCAIQAGIEIICRTTGISRPKKV